MAEYGAWGEKRKEQGKWAEKMAFKYIPQLQKVSLKKDLQGTDAKTKSGLTYQIKYDEKIPQTKNLYFEVEERDNEFDNWRKTPCNAKILCSVHPIEQWNKDDENCIIYKTVIKRIKKIIKKRNAKRVETKTSKGWLISITQIKHQQIEFPTEKKEKPEYPSFF